MNKEEQQNTWDEVLEFLDAWWTSDKMYPKVIKELLDKYHIESNPKEEVVPPLPVEDKEEQKLIWGDVDANYINWQYQELDIDALLKNYTIARKQLE